MKKKSSILLFPLAVFFLANSFSYKASGQVRWSGTITLEEKLTGDHMTSIRKVTVSFVNALPTLHRDDETTDLNFTDDKGTGSVSFHAESFINGKKWSTTDCQGGGQSELHEVVVNEEDNIYSIHAIGPACTGQVVDHLGGPTTAYGPEFTDLSTSDQQLVNKNHLAGTKSTTGDVAGLATVTTTITWNLDRTGPDVVLIVTPEDYDNWMPEPGRNELTVGKQIKISLKLQKRNGQPAEIKAKTFELRLLNTSKEPGITINYPVNPGTAKPDLRFQWQVGADTSAEGQFIKVNCSQPCLTGTVKVGAYDGGGWTTLTAVAVLTDNTRVMGTLLVPGGEQEILIPKRKLGSNIASKWLRENNNPGEADDNDEIPGIPHKGDGLSAYEEYRGVICEKEFGGANPAKFGRLDPQKMNLGLRVDKAELPYFTEGINWFENATKLKVLRFNETEIGPDRKLNKNAGYANIYSQYTLLLYKGLLGYAGNPLGVAYTSNMQPNIPSNTQNVVIDPGAIQNEYNVFAARERPAGLPFTQSDLLANTIAHELSHGVNIPHHGQHPDGASPQVATLPDQSPYYTFRVFERNGDAVALPVTLRGRIGISGGLQSGDLSCIMTYNPYYNWAFTRGADLARIYNRVPLIPIGNKLCTSTLGTGFNHSIIYFGDASSGGNCFEHIKLK